MLGEAVPVVFLGAEPVKEYHGRPFASFQVGDHVVADLYPFPVKAGPAAAEPDVRAVHQAGKGEIDKGPGGEHGQ